MMWKTSKTKAQKIQEINGKEELKKISMRMDKQKTTTKKIVAKEK